LTMLVDRKGQSRTRYYAITLFVALAFGLAFILLQQPGWTDVTDSGTKEQATTGQGSGGDHSSHEYIPGSELPNGGFGDTRWSQDQDKDISALLTEEEHTAMLENLQIPHQRLYSKTTSDGNYIKIDFLSRGAYNPSILPHPYKNNTWVVVANPEKSDPDLHDYWTYQLVCEAVLNGNNLTCIRQPLNLPIASTVSPHCVGNQDWYNGVIGPHDARIYHGLDHPYITYVSQSAFNCVGQWMQDLRRIVDWGTKGMRNQSEVFFWPTNLQRPPPYRSIEKNWFPFWDAKGEMYLHTDTSPKRVFAKLHPDGSVGEDLAPLAASHDEACMERFMPALRPNELEYMHQATNALAITMCKRSDLGCVRTEDNTFLFTIFQHKSFYWHGQYSPYVMVFEQKAPFKVHGISSKPLWISGRGVPGGHWRDGTTKPWDQTEMMFITSIAWKDANLTYHGYMDDDLFINFGIEDKRAGTMDVAAGDVLAYLNLCST